MNDEYPESDYPWTFYFNGEAMPKWGACWPLAGITRFLDSAITADSLNHSQVYEVYCRIDHVGCLESADPDVFGYVVREVLAILLGQRKRILARLARKPGMPSKEIYRGLLEAALRMGDLAGTQHRAFWITGYEGDRVFLMEAMRRNQLPHDSPDHRVAPHVRWFHAELQGQREWQTERLRKLAETGRFDAALRRRLLEMEAR